MLLPSEIAEHRPYLLRFALLQLRQPDFAEDVVQEAMLAALKAADGFSGRATARTWLTAILLHKIADHRRRAGREVSLDAHQEAQGADSLEAVFQANGAYVSPPREWRNPEESLADRQFFEALDDCIGRLSPAAGQVFLLRELMGLTVAEICMELGLSASNCSVLLHRARLRLRACLEERWFDARDARQAILDGRA